MEQLGLARRTIRPDTKLRDVIDPDRAAHIWSALEQAVQSPVWPPLVRPSLLTGLLYTLACAVCVGIFFCSLSTGIVPAASAAFVATMVFAILAILATERWRTRIPGQLAEIRDLVPYAAASDRIEWTRDKVSNVVKLLVMEQLGLSESDYHEDARFIEDLGMD